MQLQLEKNKLKDGRYYSGHIKQNFTTGDLNESKIAKWNSKNDCFLFWDVSGKLHKKTSIQHLSDINNEIELGFQPFKEVIPKEDDFID